MAVQSPKITLVVGIDVFWNCKIEKKILRNFQSPPFFLFISPCHSFDTWNIIFPEETLNKGKGNPLSIDDSARIVCSQTPVPHQMPRGPDCFSDRQLKNWFDLQFLSQPLINSSCSAAVDRVRNSSEKISSSTVEIGRSPELSWLRA